MNKGETEQAALRRFQGQDFASDQEAAALGTVPREPRLILGIPEHKGGPDKAASSNSFGNRLRVSAQTITLPALGIPEAIRQRRTNRFVEDLIRSQGKGGCMVVVPFADLHSPLVPVLSLCPGRRGIQFMRKDGDSWAPTAGGWMTDDETLRRFEPLIRKHASLTIMP